MTTPNKEVVIFSTARSIGRILDLSNNTIDSIIGHNTEFMGEPALAVSASFMRNLQVLFNPGLLIGRDWSGIAAGVVPTDFNMENPPLTAPAMRVFDPVVIYSYNAVSVPRESYGTENMPANKNFTRWNCYFISWNRINGEDGELSVCILGALFGRNHSHDLLSQKVSDARHPVTDA